MLGEWNVQVSVSDLFGVSDRNGLRYKPRRDIPKFAREYRTLSPSKIREIVLVKRNRNVTAESITMWFKRHPDIQAKLKVDVIAEELPKIEVSETIFNNGTFEELPSVKEWLIQLDARELSRDYIQQKINLLKRVCKGRMFDLDLTKPDEEGKVHWCLKHPDRLTLKEAMEFISIIRKKGKDTYYVKRDLKDFIESKGIAVGKRIAVGKPKGYGKYAKLFVVNDTLKEVLEWLKTINFETYVVDEFMYKTGTRIEATRKALIEEIVEIDDKGVITVYDKGRKSKYPKGHPLDKRLDAELLRDIKELIGDRKHGKIFSVGYNKIRKLNRKALEKFAPQILHQYPDLYINHFWRHMFFQHILRKCNWNYTIAGALGGATPQSVEESYGKPPEETINQWNETYTIKI